VRPAHRHDRADRSKPGERSHPQRGKSGCCQALWQADQVNSERLPGGFDRGADLVAGTVRRSTGSWTASVHHLLAHLAAAGFSRAPRPLGRDPQGREVLTFLEGHTVGETRPWPAWVHSDAALEQVADWLSGYHGAVADFVPPADAVWREGRTWRPGLIIAHGDPGPYNAVWDTSGLVGFVDWDMAGPSTREADVAWTAFCWVPLHARRVVAAEGFTAFEQRRKWLEAFLGRYGWDGSTDEVLDLVAARIEEQLHAMLESAAAGDPAYQRMLQAGRDHDLRSARDQLADI
jgi:hypothetical protein